MRVLGLTTYSALQRKSGGTQIIGVNSPVSDRYGRKTITVERTVFVTHPLLVGLVHSTEVRLDGLLAKNQPLGDLSIGRASFRRRCQLRAAQFDQNILLSVGRSRRAVCRVGFILGLHGFTVISV